MNRSTALAAAFLCVLGTPVVWAHCEVPCGIYNDDMRMAMIAEDITTIEKGMSEIAKLSKEGAKDYNQIVRWVTNKETHAKRIQETVTQYFMFQRVKPVDAKNAAEHIKYLRKLKLLHQMAVRAMKAKQTTDPQHTKALRTLLDEFHSVYHDHHHAHEGHAK